MPASKQALLQQQLRSERNNCKFDSIKRDNNWTI
uniref:Uncharacterized protein n=1 Tax=Rhizophora mucronata TaxID=61149 RepID=A0A2P2PLT4_RHIMU